MGMILNGKEYKLDYDGMRLQIYERISGKCLEKIYVNENEIFSQTNTFFMGNDVHIIEGIALTIK